MNREAWLCREGQEVGRLAARDDVQLPVCRPACCCLRGWAKGFKGNESFQGVRCQVSSKVLVTAANECFL